MIRVGVELKFYCKKSRKENAFYGEVKSPVDWKRPVVITRQTSPARCTTNAYHSASIASSRHRFSLSRRNDDAVARLEMLNNGGEEFERDRERDPPGEQRGEERERERGF